MAENCLYSAGENLEEAIVMIPLNTTICLLQSMLYGVQMLSFIWKKNILKKDWLKLNFMIKKFEA